MIKTKYIIIALFCSILTNCTSKKHEFPTNKRYWNIDDYDKVISELNYGYEEDEKKPTLNNPEEKIIVEKLTDEENFRVVLDDNELGLNHKSEVAAEFFNQWKDMYEIYQELDRKDNYVYELEMLSVYHFGLGLQLEYFKLGIEQIKQNSDDPNSSRAQLNINSNYENLINNYLLYLDEINTENSFSDEGKSKFASGIDKYFTQLIELYPDADYSGMKRKAELMLNKSESSSIKTSLNNLITLINSKEANAI